MFHCKVNVNAGGKPVLNVGCGHIRVGIKIEKPLSLRESGFWSVVREKELKDFQELNGWSGAWRNR
jgi:hypothetical protein